MRGGIVAIGGTALALCNVGFSRRYLHGEFMYDRFLVLAFLMLTGFNLIAAAAPTPTDGASTHDLRFAAMGWSLLSFSSVFLISAWNERPTARENATFIYLVYAVTDGAMLLAWAFSDSPSKMHKTLTAACLLVAAFMKCSQFPLSNLFARCMEGASPSSALGYAALSAHAGLVLLSSTMEIWYSHSWARYALAAVGGLTVLNAGLVSQVRADRKGSLGNAIATTVGVLYMILAAGYVQTALVLALGHATYRMVQILRAHNIILEFHINQETLGHENVGPKEVPEWLYRICWRLNRLNTDTQLPHILHKLRWNIAKSWELSKPMQWLVTGILLAQAGVPLTPITEWREEMLVQIDENADLYQALAALALVGVVVLVSTGLVWLVNMSVLDPLRFRYAVTNHAKSATGLKQPLLHAEDALVGS